LAGSEDAESAVSGESLFFLIKSIIPSAVLSPSYCSSFPLAEEKYMVGYPVTLNSFGTSFAVASYRQENKIKFCWIDREKLSKRGSFID
jgi:hypothetical protein